jgi:hypothetical protein
MKRYIINIAGINSSGDHTSEHTALTTDSKEKMQSEFSSLCLAYPLAIVRVYDFCAIDRNKPILENRPQSNNLANYARPESSLNLEQY